MSENFFLSPQGRFVFITYKYVNFHDIHVVFLFTTDETGKVCVRMCAGQEAGVVGRVPSGSAGDTGIIFCSVFIVKC